MAWKRGLRWGGGLFLVTILALLLAWAFQMGQQGRRAESELERPVQVPLRLETQHGETLITLDPSDLAATKIETTPLEKLARPATVTAYGRVLDLTPLLDLQSRFAAALAQEEQARTTLVTAQREYERFKSLYDQGGIVSQKQVEDAQAAVQANEATVRASQTSRQALYDTIRQGWGEVLAKDLERRTPAFQRLAGRKELLVELTLSPGAQPASAPMLAAIRSGTVGPVQGKLVAPAPQSKADIQGVAYLFAVPAASQGAGGSTAQGLLPGMAVTAWLPAGPVQRGVVVPDDAVVWKDGKAWIFLKKDPSHFVRRGIILESPTGRGWFIPEDQLPDLPVVIRGAQVLLSEESRGQVRPEV